MKKFRFLNMKKGELLPKKAGVYCFRNKNGKVLYIGKAANLKERMKNHFQQSTFKDGLFLNKIEKISYIKTNSEIEALILEAKLIKKCRPKFNIMWRDDKNYFFVGITKEDFPRVFITHQPAKIFSSKKLRRASQKPIYIGPFIDGTALKQVLKILRKVFPFRSCKNIPKRPCLWYQLSRCPAPCLLKSPKESLRDPTGQAPHQSLRHGTGQANLGFQLSNAKMQIRKVCQQNAKNLEKILRGKKKWVLSTLRKGMKKASKNQEFEKAAKIRDRIISLERVFEHQRFLELPTPPLKNAGDKIRKELKIILEIQKNIKRIEAYDVSNIQGKLATGSMVVFIDGKPDKSQYRKFKIKIAGKPNDTAMIKEVLTRRFNHPEWPFPDVILIDGGRAQLNTAISISYQHKSAKSASISVLALAKKENKLFTESKKAPILLKELPREIFNLILQLRDEAHRFAIGYHRKLRRRALID